MAARPGHLVRAKPAWDSEGRRGLPRRLISLVILNAAGFVAMSAEGVPAMPGCIPRGADGLTVGATRARLCPLLGGADIRA